jgi:hypothetical protein
MYLRNECHDLRIRSLIYNSRLIKQLTTNHTLMQLQLALRLFSPKLHTVLIIISSEESAHIVQGTLQRAYDPGCRHNWLQQLATVANKSYNPLTDHTQRSRS